MASRKEIIAISLLFLGIGYLMATGIEGSRKEEAALDWAIATVRQCHETGALEAEGDIAVCLMIARGGVDENRRMDALADKTGPE